MAKFMMTELIPTTAQTSRLPVGVTDKDVGKAVKLTAESQYTLCVVGDQIEGVIAAVETATMDGFPIGSVVNAPGTRKEVVFDGTQAAGTGALTIGTRVVCGTPAALGTSGPLRVRSATTQTGMDYVWRIVSLGSAGTGAVGTVGVIERVS